MSQPVSSNPEVQLSFDVFSKGYDAGVVDVLVALAEFCGQGGVVDKDNVTAWANTWGKASNA